MRTLRVIGSGLVLGLGLALWAPAQPVESTNSPAEALAGVLTRLDQLVSVPEADASRTFTTTIKVLRADGLPKELTGREVEVAWQAPDHLRLSGRWEDQDAILARDGQEVWTSSATVLTTCGRAPRWSANITEPRCGMILGWFCMSCRHPAANTNAAMANIAATRVVICPLTPAP